MMQELSIGDCFTRIQQIQKKDEQIFGQLEKTKINLLNANKVYRDQKKKEQGEKNPATGGVTAPAPYGIHQKLSGQRSGEQT